MGCEIRTRQWLVHHIIVLSTHFYSWFFLIVYETCWICLIILVGLVFRIYQRSPMFPHRSQRSNRHAWRNPNFFSIVFYQSRLAMCPTQTHFFNALIFMYYCMKTGKTQELLSRNNKKKLLILFNSYTMSACIGTVTNFGRPSYRNKYTVILLINLQNI